MDTAQKKPNPVERGGDATWTTLEEQTGKNMERKSKASYRDDEKADRVPERRSSCDDEQEGKAYVRIGSYRDSESGKKTSNKRKGPYHEDNSREKTTQKILK